MSARTLRALLAATTALLLRASSAHAANLWVAFETGADGWRPQLEDFFACVTGATNFNTLVQAWGSAPVYFAGDAVVGHCGTNNWTCTISDVDCVIHDASFASRIQPGDTVLYVNTGPCGGWNDRRVNVTVNGASIPIHFGETGDLNSHGTQSFACQTWTSMHEVYEATTNGISADCCSHETSFGSGGQTQCAWRSGESRYGTYTLLGCAGESFTAQAISPVGHSYDDTTCADLHVDTTSLCAQPRAAREAGVCQGGNVVRCTYGPTVEDCQGRGCVDSPTPHCNGFDAQCQIDGTATMCAGATSPVTIRCTNTGTDAWNGNVQIGAAPAGSASPFADMSWVSNSIAADATPSSVPVGSTATFGFVLHAPSVSSSTMYTLQWALVQGGTYQTMPAPSALTLTTTVSPCGRDAGADAATDSGAHAADAHNDAADVEVSMIGAADAHEGGEVADAGARVEGGEGGPMTEAMRGCACRASGARSRGGAPAMWALGLALVLRARRRSRTMKRALSVRSDRRPS